MAPNLPPRARSRARRRLLERLAAGDTVAAACKAAGVNKTTVYDWRHRDPDFDAAWLAAVDAGVVATLDQLADEARRRAVDGVRRPVYQGGVQVGETIEYSDCLLALLLRTRRREVFAPNYKLFGAAPVPTVTVRIILLDDAEGEGGGDPDSPDTAE
jgi:hypothetical protein